VTWQLAILVIAAFLLTNNVWSPQYSLWLLRLAVLALPRWRPLMFWQASEAITWVLLMLYFDGEAKTGLSIDPFINAALLRDAMVLVLVAWVIRDIVRPAGDLVRMTGDDDPSGGCVGSRARPVHRAVTSGVVDPVAGHAERAGVPPVAVAAGPEPEGQLDPA
jgi:uncharacterized membrane protein